MSAWSTGFSSGFGGNNMTFPVSQPGLQSTLSVAQSTAQGIQQRLQTALFTLQSGSVDALWMHNFIAQAKSVIGSLNTINMTGLNAYANANIPNYTGTISTDIATIISNLQACITWIVANYPTSGGFVLGISISADGTFTYRQFTTVQTAGLQTAIQAVLNSIA